MTKSYWDMTETEKKELCKEVKTGLARWGEEKRRLDKTLTKVGRALADYRVEKAVTEVLWKLSRAR